MPEVGTAGPRSPVRGGRRLPVWLWVVAIGGGLVVGYILMKKFPAGGGASDQAQPDQASQPDQLNPSVASPIDPALLQAMGLTPPNFEQFLSGGGGGGGGGTETSTADTGIAPNAAGYYNLGGPQLSPAQTTFQSGLAPSRPTTPFLGGLVKPSGSTAPTSGGSGKLYAI